MVDLHPARYRLPSVFLGQSLALDSSIWSLLDAFAIHIISDWRRPDDRI